MPRRAAALLAGLLAAVPARADYKDSYRKGIEALDRKRWDDVVRHMKEAIAENPKEGERVKLYGLRFETYFPHFHLGAAYLNLGRCPEALRAFETSQSQGAIRTSGKNDELIEGMKSCEGHGPKTAPAPTTTVAAGPDPAAVEKAVQAAEAALAKADAAARELGPLAVDPSLAASWTREAGLGPAEAAARESLTAARTRLAAARRASDMAQIEDARQAASLAQVQLEGVKREAERRRDDARRRASAPPSTAPSVSAPSRAAAPPELLAGAESFFAGRYAEAIERLDKVTGLKGRAAAQRALLAAAARFAAYRLSGETDEALRERMAADVEACRRSDPSLTPDPGVFTPEFAALFGAR
jgi:tetratricopeptide (TPR) repeat protein